MTQWLFWVLMEEGLSSWEMNWGASLAAPMKIKLDQTIPQSSLAPVLVASRNMVGSSLLYRYVRVPEPKL